MVDLIIIGAGPAGSAAAVYAARKKLKTTLLTGDFGGQSVVSPDIQNWIGSPSISGPNLAKALRTHVGGYEGDLLAIHEGELATNLEKIENGFKVTTKNSTYEGRTVFIATGSHRKKLNVPGADRLEHKGLTYCATCDGPLFTDQDVVVVGGGNAGFESAAQLLAYTKSVTLLHRGDAYKADPVTVEKVLSHENMTGILHSEPTEIVGDAFVQGIRYKNTQTNEEASLDVTGIFVEIGAVPTSDFAKNLIELTSYGQIKTDPYTQQTSLAGIWAAGDVTDGLYHQNNIAAGDAVKAVEDIYKYLKI